MSAGTKDLEVRKIIINIKGNPPIKCSHFIGGFLSYEISAYYTK